jgi:hypothetical protein
MRIASIDSAVTTRISTFLSRKRRKFPELQGDLRGVIDRLNA